MKSKTNTRQNTILTARHRNFLIFLFFLILSIFELTYAQEQWRVFTTANSPLPSNITAGIIVDKNNIKWIGTPSGMVKIEGNNWQIFDTTNTPLGTNGIYPAALDSFNNIWCILTSKGIAKFDGSNWIVYDTANSGLPGYSNISISIDNNNVKWICTPGLIRFDDINWTLYNTTNSGLPSNVVTSVVFENYIKWVGTFSLFGGMAKFNDTNWVIYNTSNSGLSSNTIRYVGIDKLNNKWICTDFGGLCKFNSVSNNWTVYNTTNSGLPGNDVFTINIDNHIKWIGMSSTGLASFNDTIWNVFNTTNSPIPNNFINRIVLDKFSNVWLTTHGGIVIYNPINIIGINYNYYTYPKVFKLYQNYPNPFNSTTRIKYQVSKMSHIRLKVFDVMGREVNALVNQSQSVGYYTVSFDSKNLASGIYFYRLIVTDASAPLSIINSETKKMVLVK